MVIMAISRNEYLLGYFSFLFSWTFQKPNFVLEEDIDHVGSISPVSHLSTTPSFTTFGFLEFRVIFICYFSAWYFFAYVTSHDLVFILLFRSSFAHIFQFHNKHSNQFRISASLYSANFVAAAS